jgi:transposase InsO family protein
MAGRQCGNWTLTPLTTMTWLWARTLWRDRFHRWLANLRVLEIDEIKSAPCVPISHPFVERPIGTLRREYLDRTFFWNALDLERNLQAFGLCYNGSRVHQSLGRSTPEEKAGKARPGCATLSSFGWREHCRGLFQTPIAA